MISFEIPGEPVGKARARVTKWGTYTPEKTENYEALIKYTYMKQCNTMYEGALKMMIHAYYLIPKSASKSKQAMMKSNEILPTKKPDADNVIKIICDALNKIAYKDDSQIVELVFSKEYSHEPKVKVYIDTV